MKMRAYPFLWGKSENFVGWNCIAQPEFLRGLEGPAGRVLEEAQAGIVLAPDEIRVVRGADPKYGVLDIAYRRVPSPYTEKGGRPFDFIEGLVLRDRYPSLSFSSKDFDAARAAVQLQYEKFVSAESWPGDASWHSATIDIDGLSHEPPLRILEANSRFLPPPTEKTRPRSPSGESFVGDAMRKPGRQAPADFLEQKMAENARKAAGPSDDPGASRTSLFGEQQDLFKLLLFLAAAGGAWFLVTELFSFIGKKR